MAETLPAAHCIVFSALGLLNVREYLAAHPDAFGQRLLYVVASTPATARQIDGLISPKDWTRVRVIWSGSVGGALHSVAKFGRLIRGAMTFRRALRGLGQQDQLIVSHIDNPYTRLAAACRPAGSPRIIVVDDGTTTIEDHARLCRDGVSMAGQGTKLSMTAKAQRALLSTRSITAEEVAFFSMFPLPQAQAGKIVHVTGRNRFDRLKQLPRSRRKVPKVYFLGQPFVWRNRVSATEYEAALACIADRYDKQGLTFVYFPHRNETSDSGARYPKIVHDKPFEQWLLEQDEEPTMIAGFYSNAVLMTAYLLGRRMKYELFWGFPGMEPAQWGTNTITNFIELEASGLGIEINHTLGAEPLTTYLQA